MKINRKDRNLLKNTIMLYVLQFSTYFFSFVTVPYQTRVLGPKIYGVLGVAIAVMMYFQLFMDFGFLLSATEDISLRREDRAYVSKKLTSVALIKVMFAVVSLIILLVLCNFEPFSNYKKLYVLYLFAYAINSFLPDYFFRGIEKMFPVTIRTVSVKAVSCLMTFMLLKTKEDYLIVPILLLVGNLVAVVWAYIYIYAVLGYKIERVTIQEVWKDLKRSSLFFLSRIATTVYSATNTIVLSFVDKTGTATGFYTSADKVISTAKSGISPVSDSLYPYMVKNKNFKMVKKVLLLLEPIIVVGCIIVFVFAQPICGFVFGKEFVGTAPVLQAFVPVVAVILPSYILGFPTLGAMGLSKYANYSIFFGMTIHVLGLSMMALSSNITAVNLAAMTSVSEISIMLFRLIIVLKNKNKFEENQKNAKSA